MKKSRWSMVFLISAFVATISVAELPSGSKTYQNPDHKFELKFPLVWEMIDYSTASDLQVSFKPPSNDFQIIPFVSNQAYDEFSCPMEIHVIDCKDAVNPNGAKYVRVVFTGMLEDYRHQYLRIFLKPSETIVYAELELTDVTGMKLPSAEKTLNILNSMIASFKFIDTQQMKPPNPSVQRTPTRGRR